MFTLTTTDTEEGNEIIQGIFFYMVLSDVHVLFDTGSTHYFIAPHVICHVPIPRTILSYYLVVSTPRGMVLMGSEVL